MRRRIDAWEAGVTLAVMCDTCSGPLVPIPDLAVHGCHRCLECGLVVCLPLPDDAETQYEAPDYFQNLEKREVADAKVLSFRAFASAVRSVLPAGASAFEFGSGTGALVRALRDEGINATGSDISAFAAEQGLALYGVEVAVGPAESVPIPSSPDVVIALHVIEHLRSPNAFLARVRDAVSPGAFLILEVPDFAAKMRDQLGAAWPHFRPGEHLYHFDEDSLGAALGRHGFRVFRRERVGGLGLLQPGSGTDGVGDPGDTAVPRGWRRPVYGSRNMIYRVPGARTAVRTLNRRVGYDLLHRNAAVRLWARAD